MAMLAEKKHRLKWCLNPRGKQWSDDQTKFGQRILEKMGWSAGQGLGINKQGPTEIVKVKKKDDSAGLGFKENREKWLETTNEYNQLLDQLASTEENEKDQADVSSSLEDRSKKSKARVHYHKFTRGKDLSRYSEKDLASIIGPDLVKYESIDFINADYKSSQTIKGSSTEYFNGKNSSKHNTSPESEPTINEDTNNKEQAGGSLYKKHKKSETLGEGDAQETYYKLKQSNKKRKKSKQEKEQVSDYHSYNSKYLNSKKIFKEKNKNLGGIRIETIEHINKLENTNNCLNSCTSSEEIVKTNKKVNKIKNKNSIEPEIENSIENPCEEQNEKYVHCEKLLKVKSKNMMISGELKRTTNGNKGGLKTVENVKLTPSDCEHNCYESNKSSSKDEELNSDVHIIPVENSISRCSEIYEDNLTYKFSKYNIQRLENNCKSCIDFENKEENVVSKKKKKIKQHNVQDNGYIDKLEIVRNKNFSKKRKSENKDETIDDFENNKIKRKKHKKENIESLTHEDDSVLNLELDKEPSRDKQLPKHTKIRNKSKRRNKKKDQSTFDTEANADLKSPENLHNINKENKCYSITTSINNNEDITSKSTSGCLTLFGHKTCLNNLNSTQNTAKCEQFATVEFMAFSDSKNVSSTKSSVCENRRNSKNNSCQRIYLEPNNEDSNISMNVANYEYRLIRSKIKLLNIPTGDVKIVIKNNITLPKKLHKKLKLLYKSKYYKSFLPADELATIEASIEDFAAKLQPRIDVINELLEIENQTVKLNNEVYECGMLADSNKKQTGKDILTPEKNKTLKGMKKKFKLLSKVGKGTINVTARNKQELTDKKRSKLATSNSNNNNKNGKVSSGGAFEEVSAPVDSLQTRIEERLRVLAEQMNQLSEGRKLLYDKNNSHSNERKSIPCRWGRGSQGGWSNTSNKYNSTRTKECSGPTHGRYKRGAVQSRMRGRGIGTVLRGRISKNNFDAKQYAVKCKFKNILPEVTFKGVDLKVIPGYAANDTAIELSSYKT